MKRFALSIIYIGLVVSGVAAQPPAEIEVTKSVVAAGGGKSVSTKAATYEIEGTIGQPAAGVRSSNGTYAVTGGFWQALLTPTAAPATIAGRVETSEGMPIFRARVTFRSATGEIYVATTNQAGRFILPSIPSGETYLVEVQHRGHSFQPFTLAVNETIEGLVIRPGP